jgi:hypothetical protein
MRKFVLERCGLTCPHASTALLCIHISYLQLTLLLAHIARILFLKTTNDDRVFSGRHQFL